MRTFLPLATLVALAGPVACGPAPTPAAPTGQQGDVKPSSAQVAAGPSFDLSPVAEPTDVVGMLRWSSPTTTLSSIASCAGLPPALADANAQLIVSGVLKELVSRSIDTRQLGAVVALDAPVHLMIAIDKSSRRGKPIGAVSIGLSSLERAKGALEGGAALAEVSPGMWKINGKEPSRSSCFIAASAGSTPARLICGDRDRDVTTLGPYLARTLPTLAPEGRDVHGEIRFVPLSAAYGPMAKQQLRGLPILAQSQLSIGSPKFDRALDEATSALQGELVALIDDADKATIDLAIDGKSCVSLSQGISLRGRSAWLAGTMNDSAGRAAPAPALYWRLPKDSDMAFFAHGVDPSNYAGMWKTLRTMLEGWLEKENIGKPAERKLLADVLSPPFSKASSSASASGPVAPPTAPAKASDKPKPRDAIESFLDSWLGWNLVGVDEEPDAVIKYLKNAVAAYNTPGLRAKLAQLDDDAKQLPTVKVVPAPKELGKSSLAVEITVKDIPRPGAAPPIDAKATKAKPLTLTMHMLLMGEDKATWIAFGQDKRELLRRLAMVKAGVPEADTLASRPGLEPLKTGKLVSGGFMTIAPITRALGNGLDVAMNASAGALASEARQLTATLGNLPHKGEGLILLTTQAQGGGAPRAEISLNMSKPALEDIGALVLAGLKLAGVLSN